MTQKPYFHVILVGDLANEYEYILACMDAYSIRAIHTSQLILLNSKLIHP